MSKDMGAPQADGLAGAEAPEPPSRLGPAGGIPSAIEEAARRAIASFELARTGVVRPANGSAPYSYVTFAGARIRFDQTDFSKYHNGSVVYDGATDKAAEQADRINEILMEVAYAAARNAYAQVGTHPQGGDAKQAPGDSLSDAVGNADAPQVVIPADKDPDAWLDPDAPLREE